MSNPKEIIIKLVIEKLPKLDRTKERVIKTNKNRTSQRKIRIEETELEELEQLERKTDVEIEKKNKLKDRIEKKFNRLTSNLNIKLIKRSKKTQYLFQCCKIYQEERKSQKKFIDSNLQSKCIAFCNEHLLE